MVDLEVLKAHGISAEGLKKHFVGTRAERVGRGNSDKIEGLIDRMINRAQGGRDLNLEMAKVFRALDDALDSAFDQITPTLLKSMMDRPPETEKELDNQLRSMGVDLNDVLMDVPDPKTPGKNTKRLNIPAFFKITVPLCMAYLKIRWAKLTNDRKQVPFFKYESVISDEQNRIRCALITEAIEQKSKQYSYFETFKQAVFQSLHYAEALQFPVEEWHSECQWVEAGAPYDKAEADDSEENEKTVDDVKTVKVIMREGIRYHLPHPSRFYYDRSFPVNTLNTDTGCSYAGYWRVVRWGQIMDLESSGYYNLDKVGYEDFARWFSNKKGAWVNNLRGCALDFPDVTGDATSAKDSEKHISKWYSRDMADKPVVVTEHFEKIVPKDYGIGDYDCSVWIRFVLAADDTVIYAAPVGYDPAVIWWGYDYIHGRTHNVSLTLECMPFQDQFTNLLSQHLLTVKQNLMNLTLIDTEIVPEDVVKTLENFGERFWRRINLLRIRGSELFKRKAGAMTGSNADPMRSAIYGHKFPPQDTNQTLGAMRLILDTLERVIVVSSQEVGQSASHEQTREEIRHIATNTSSRVRFTDTGFDASIDAWKRQLYNAMMSRGRMSVIAHVPMEEPIDAERYKKLGFTAHGAYNDRTRKQVIKANSTALRYESFVADRDGQNRGSETESGKMMLELFTQVMGNQLLAPAVGPDQALKVINQIARFLGFPRDFKLENTNQTQSMQDQVGQALEQLKQYIDQGMGSMQEDIKGALQNIVKVNEDQDKAIESVLNEIKKISGQSMPTLPALPAPSDSDVMPEPATINDLARAGVSSY